MPTKKKKTEPQKKTRKQTKKKAEDYLRKKDGFKPPESAKKVNSQILKFTEIGQHYEGFFTAFVKSETSGKSSTIELTAKNDDIQKIYASKAISDQVETETIKFGDYVYLYFEDVADIKGGRTFKNISVYVDNKIKPIEVK